MSSIEQFLEGITHEDGSPLSVEEKKSFCSNLKRALIKSDELAKIHYNTQVYNVIENGVTTRGGHSVGVATVARELAAKQAEKQGLSADEIAMAADLAECFGYMHDLGHTPFGHDGEGALGDEMSRFQSTDEYQSSRETLFGEKYASSTKSDEMCYEHNETSAVISQAFLIEFAKNNHLKINDVSMGYVKTAILAHSTSRVKEEPTGLEQQAVRLADKVAYIPQDLADLLKQGVINYETLTNDELVLLGLNVVKDENDPTLLPKEKEFLENISPEAKAKRIKEINAKREEILDRLKTLVPIDPNKPQKTEEEINIELSNNELFEQINSRISDKQREIAQHCVDGQGKLNGFKETFDKLVKLAEGIEKQEAGPDGKTVTVFYEADKDNDKEIAYKTDEEGKIVPKNKAVEGSKEFIAATLIQKLNSAIVDYDNVSTKQDTKGLSIEEARKNLGNATKNLKDFLVDKEKGFGMEETMATLWITKHKYQDSFIKGRMHIHGERLIDSSRFKKSLGGLNNRNENSWKMKTTFQYFLVNFNQIPQDFLRKYEGTGYNSQQIVSAYIASFTNESLNVLYEKLVKEKAIMTREDAAKNIALSLRDKNGYSKYEASEVLDTLIPSIKKKLKKDGVKISENDILEYLVESQTGFSIVSGKKEGMIPYSEEQLKTHDAMESEYESSGREPKLLEGAIENGVKEVSLDTIEKIQEEVKNFKKSEIDKHKESQKGE